MVFPDDGVLPKTKTLTRAQSGALVGTGGKGILWFIAQPAQCPILGVDQHTSRGAQTFRKICETSSSPCANTNRGPTSVNSRFASHRFS